MCSLPSSSSRSGVFEASELKISFLKSTFHCFLFIPQWKLALRKSVWLSNWRIIQQQHNLQSVLLTSESRNFTQIKKSRAEILSVGLEFDTGAVLSLLCPEIIPTELVAGHWHWKCCCMLLQQPYTCLDWQESQPASSILCCQNKAK